MAIELTGQMRYVTLIPNGEFGDQKIKMYKAILQDCNTMELHEFFITEQNGELIKQMNSTRPMEDVLVKIELVYDRFAISNKKSPSKYKLTSIRPLIKKA